MTLLAALVAALTLEQQVAVLEKSGAICSVGAVNTFYARSETRGARHCRPVTVAIAAQAGRNHIDLRR